ncbi:MAG: phosphohistidine phosphatase SixA [Candidatus Hydrogenedentes bacterium]|nr:phosphohistidine phosphatase SixA [Candidatus Hydrogenedentota bacterium]
MKTLLIMRHAKSSWEEGGQPDHERPLNDRGLRDAPRMGTYLTKKGFAADAILTSSARRARRTAEIVASAMDRSDRVEVIDALYLADPLVYLASLRHLPDEVRVVLVVGHNPGVSEWATKLTRRQVELPTAAVACVTLPINEWATINGGTPGMLLDLWLPKKIDG